MRLTKSDQSGETIVAVLIALSILGLILGINYRIAGSSLRATRSAQERTEGSLLANATIEAVKAYTTSPAALDDPAVEDKIFPTGPLEEICVSTDIADLLVWETPRSFNATDAMCNDGIYRIRVQVRVLPGQTYEYTATADWESIDSNRTGATPVRDRAEARYRWVREP